MEYGVLTESEIASLLELYKQLHSPNEIMADEITEIKERTRINFMNQQALTENQKRHLK
jgi:hypothetical protein